LKNAYYKNTTELETLPNIDINIKCGNSLVSRFAIDADLKQALKKSKWTIDGYRVAVSTYRNAESKEQKREMERLIADIKSDFKSEINRNDPKLAKLYKLNGELTKLTTQVSMFGMSDKEKKDWNKEVEKITQEIEKLEAEIEEIKANKIYENAFEWRFEFPEVLNNEGDFVGFDVVIGNPPYGLFNKKQNKKIALTTDDLIIELLKNKYPEATGGVINAARIFLAFSYTISSNIGFQCMIIPYGILTDTTSVNLRKHIFLNHTLIKVDAFPERDNANKRVFEDVKMSTTILLTSKRKAESYFDIGLSFDRTISENRSNFNAIDLIKLNPDLVQIPLTNTKAFNLLVKVYSIKGVVKFGNVTPCLTGEIDMTFGKPALTANQSDAILLKGVQIDRYIQKTKKEQISQGEIEFVNVKKLSTIISDKKFSDSSQRRIALQGLTGVNESRRIKANIIEKDIFLANSCNYLLEPTNCILELLICWLNSKLLNFIFKARSTSSNVNGYEIDNLPFCFTQYDQELIELSKSILLKKAADIQIDTSALEREIDKRIYQTFNLTEEEIEIIENSL
jgi:adenine-specific DNA-methyltransferase